MCNEHREFRNYIIQQKEMFWRARFEHGLPPSLLAKKSGIPIQTIAGWANGTAMPAWAFSLLCRFIPDEITSGLMEPSGKLIATADPGEGCIDELGREASSFTAEYVERKSDGILCHRDQAVLGKRAGRLGAVAGRAARSAAA